jgi:hypothetical protein
MSKPETLKDIIEETMRVSGVPYKVPVGGVTNADSVSHPPHYKRRWHRDAWDVHESHVGPLSRGLKVIYRGGLRSSITMPHGQQGRCAYKKLTEGLALPRNISRLPRRSAQDENG